VELAGRARKFALHAYGTEERLAHPLEVATLVESTGYPDELVAAAVLHDVIEDTDVDAAQIAAEFGSRIAALVATLTEDESIRSYTERKLDLRQRASAAGPDAALVFAADKISNARRMRRRQKDPKERKIAHYEASLALLRAEHPGLPLLDQLGKELAALRADIQRVPA